LNGNKLGGLARKLIHILFSALLFLSTYRMERETFLLLLLFLFLSLSLWEYMRLKRPFFLPKVLRFEGLLKEREGKRVSDAWFFLLGVLAGSLFLWGDPLRSLLLVLGVSDPLAYFLGTTISGPRIYKEKTLCGSAGFFLSAFLLLLIFCRDCGLSVFHLFLLALLTTLCNLSLSLGDKADIFLRSVMYLIYTHKLKGLAKNKRRMPMMERGSF